MNIRKLAVSVVAISLFAGSAQSMPVLWPCGSAENAGGASSVMCTFNGGTLAVVGTGAMADYHGCPACDVENNVGPWYDTHRGEITAVIIDSGITHVGTYAFWNLPELTSVTIGKDVETIGDFAFSDLPKLATAEIGGGVENIGNGAFVGCSELRLVYSYNPVPPEFLPNIICEICPPGEYCPPCPVGSFSGVPHDAVLYVPSAGFTAYETSNSWEYHFSEIRPLMPASVRPQHGIARSRPATVASVVVRGRMLNISSPDNSALSIRMIDTRGRVRARFDAASGSGNFVLTNIPAGRYFVDVRGIGGVRQTLPVIVR